MSVAAAETSGLLRVAEIERRGRGLVASQPLRAGQVVLRDSSVLLYSAFPLINWSSSSSSYPFMANREICLNYFLDYGFTCYCDRCKVEANWFDDDDIAEEDDKVIDKDLNDQIMESSQGKRDEDFHHTYFFLRYMCDRENYGGILAPFNPDATLSEVMECNVCGNLKKY
ncbi:Histone-lysine N-methyltransferase ASHR2 [Morella rubra]|uniref:Histone-lysine N-methyltransferase ASHR2 n=1 Tax=Morella rubra TaxID=262757 RepID=A0A6A1UND9_9ROSI|nr:Histone-lysine N-methyltransferase ASHR2 [Morella rubra]KAB1207671.1 Histone-lysine N-methyltransferase ASHR2 [Morella rubra]